MELTHFKNLHAGQTGLLVGNGPNLHHTPPAYFDMPSIGMNTIHKYGGWQPTYYITVDSRVYREFGDEIDQAYPDVPKFIPTPKLDTWQGKNIVRWYQHAGEMKLGDLDHGMTFENVMHAAMQLGYYMGFTTLLIIGMEHKPEDPRAHFWGTDSGITGATPLADWLRGYKRLVDDMAAKDVQVVNVSVDTCVPDEVITRADWRNYVKSEILTGLPG